MAGKLLAALLLGGLMASTVATAQQTAKPVDLSRTQGNLVAEVQQALARGFDVVDVDRDGVVTIAELKAFAKRNGISELQIMGGSAAKFLAKNKEGVISRQEFIEAGMAAYRQGTGVAI